MSTYTQLVPSTRSIALSNDPILHPLYPPTSVRSLADRNASARSTSTNTRSGAPATGTAGTVNTLAPSSPFNCVFARSRIAAAALARAVVSSAVALARVRPPRPTRRRVAADRRARLGVIIAARIARAIASVVRRPSSRVALDRSMRRRERDRLQRRVRASALDVARVLARAPASRRGGASASSSSSSSRGARRRGRVVAMSRRRDRVAVRRRSNRDTRVCGRRGTRTLL